MKRLLFSLALALSVSGLRAQFHENGYGPIDLTKPLAENLAALSAVTDVQLVQKSGDVPLPAEVDWSGYQRLTFKLDKQEAPGAFPEGVTDFMTVEKGKITALNLKFPANLSVDSLLADLEAFYGKPSKSNRKMTGLTYRYTHAGYEISYMPYMQEDNQRVLFKPLK